MPTITFRGRVLPSICVINSAPLTLLWPEPDASGHMQFDVSIRQSIVEVVCHLPIYSPSEIEVPHIRALELARSIVDSMAFINGVGLTLRFEEVVSPSGETRSILFQNLRLPSLCTAFSSRPDAPPQDNLDAMIRLVIQDASLFVALNELIVAITIPGQVAVNCGRAIEGLRQY